MYSSVVGIVVDFVCSTTLKKNKDFLCFFLNGLPYFSLERTEKLGRVINRNNRGSAIPNRF